MGEKSNHTLAHHSAGDLLEACDVGTGNQVALHVVTLGCIGSVLVDVDHDVVQALSLIHISVWDTDDLLESRTIDMHVRTLRQKLGHAGDAICTCLLYTSRCV